MSRRIVASLSVLIASGALATGAHAEVKGHAWNTGPGGATRGECAGYAKAINSLADSTLVQTEKNNDQELLDIGKLIEGIANAGKARGCTFLGNPT